MFEGAVCSALPAAPSQVKSAAESQSALRSTRGVIAKLALREKSRAWPAGRDWATCRAPSVVLAAGPVIHHEGAAAMFYRLLADRIAEGVWDAARGMGSDQPDGLRTRKGRLRARDMRQDRACERRAQERAAGDHPGPDVAACRCSDAAAGSLPIGLAQLALQQLP